MRSWIVRCVADTDSMAVKKAGTVEGLCPAGRRTVVAMADVELAVIVAAEVVGIAEIFAVGSVEVGGRENRKRTACCKIVDFVSGATGMVIARMPVATHSIVVVVAVVETMSRL